MRMRKLPQIVWTEMDEMVAQVDILYTVYGYRYSRVQKVNI